MLRQTITRIFPNHRAEQRCGEELCRAGYVPQLTSFSPHVCPEGEDDRAVCKEIRHNSTGCLKMQGQCEKCQEILSVGEWVTCLSDLALGSSDFGSLVTDSLVLAFFRD